MRSSPTAALPPAASPTLVHCPSPVGSDRRPSSSPGSRTIAWFAPSVQRAGPYSFAAPTEGNSGRAARVTGPESPDAGTDSLASRVAGPRRTQATAGGRSAAVAHHLDVGVDIAWETGPSGAERHPRLVGCGRRRVSGRDFDEQGESGAVGMAPFGTRSARVWDGRRRRERGVRRGWPRRNRRGRGHPLGGEALPRVPGVLDDSEHLPVPRNRNATAQRSSFRSSSTGSRRCRRRPMCSGRRVR